MGRNFIESLCKCPSVLNCTCVLQFLTDGMLVREMMSDPLLKKYRYMIAIEPLSSPFSLHGKYVTREAACTKPGHRVVMMLACDLHTEISAKNPNSYM